MKHLETIGMYMITIPVVVAIVLIISHLFRSEREMDNIMGAGLLTVIVGILLVLLTNLPKK